MSKHIKNVGFIGLGAMGKPMALNLLKAGFHVNGYDLFPEKAQEIVEAGGTLMGSPKEVTEASQVVMTMINDRPNLENVFLGENGCMEGLHEGVIFMDSSTIAPNDIRYFSKLLEEKGHALLDTPVSGGVKGATEGTLTIMAGGDERAFEAAKSVLEAMGTTITYMGKSGAGQATKLCNQIMLGINTLGVSEMLMLAAKEGLDLEKVLTAVKVGSGESRMLKNWSSNMSKDIFEGKFPVKLIQKDFRLVNQTLIEDNLSLPGAALVLQLYNSVADSDPMIGHEGLLVALEKLNGFKVSDGK